MLVDFACEAGRVFVSQTTRDEQRAMGQFMTPAPIAHHMARRLLANFRGPLCRILEPAAGTGVLAAAVVEALLARDERPERIELLLCELDERLVAVLRDLGGRLATACREAGVILEWKVLTGDFLLSDLAVSGQPISDLHVISNPPFFKVGGDDPRARAHAYAVWGQPNIYGLFMAACARLVGQRGAWCFITPRSWMSGAYYQATRKCVLRHLVLEQLHEFDSRTESFADDEVLQETVIAWAAPRAEIEERQNIMLTRSRGARDLDDARMQAIPMERFVGGGEQLLLFLHQDAAQSRVEDWSATLATYGMQVSTGPVVAFRAKKFIVEEPRPGSVPLLWMQHIQQQRVSWPIAKKREHIMATAGSAWMLVRNQPLVLMRRFSPKEDERRITSAAYLGELPGDFVGLENHLNYIYRPAGSMSNAEAKGMAALLSSRLIDTYLRAVAGTTQVNASELRRLPLPPLEQIRSIGEALSETPSLAEIDVTVERILGYTSVDAHGQAA